MANNNTGFPDFPEAIEWKNLYPDDIVQQYFNTGRIPSNNGSDIVTYHDDTFGQFYTSSDRTNDENSDEEDNLIIKVFVSKDGAKIRKLAMQKGQSILPLDHELLVFLEDNTGDKLTDPICHLVAGRRAKAHIGLENVTANVIHELAIEQQDYFDLVFAAQKGQTDFLDELNLSVLKNILRETEGGESASAKAWFRQLNPKRVISKLIDKILGKFINFLKKYGRVAEKRWNPNHKEYKGNLEKLYELLSRNVSRLSEKLTAYQNKINALIKKIEGIENAITKQAYNLLVSKRNILNIFSKLVEGFKVILAIKKEDILGTINFYIGLIAGLWNGLIDLISGLLFLLQLMVKGLVGVDQLANEVTSDPAGYLKLFLEYLDNIIQAFQSFSFEGVWEAIQKGFEGLKEAIAKALDNSSAAQVGYFIGYLAFNILEFFVPITKIAKVRSVDDFFKAAAGLKAGIAKASGIITDAGSGFLKALESFIAFLRQGGEGLKKLIENIFEGIRKWLDDLVGVVKTEALFFYLGGNIFRRSVPSLEVILLEKVIKLLGKRTALRLEKLGVELYESGSDFALLYKGIGLEIGDIKKVKSKVRQLLASNPTNNVLRKRLDKLVTKIFRKTLDDYTSLRSKYLSDFKGLGAKEARAKWLARFKANFEVRHFEITELTKFYDDLIEQYPKLKNFPHRNAAEFRTKINKGGKKIEDIKELSHSGPEKLYDDFIDPIPAGETNFLNKVFDLDGRSRKHDSELKYIYHFFKNHLHKGDEFVIETRNYFRTCSSCQRELLMLKEFVESQGKTLRLVVHQDDKIRGTKDLLDKIKKYKNDN